MVGNFANLVYNGVGVITRPSDLIYLEVTLWFNFREISILEIDLEHINHGKNKARVSKLNAEEVANIVSALIDELELISSDIRQFNNGFCYYYTWVGYFNGKKYKLVFCECSDRPKSIGIITLFRI